MKKKTVKLKVILQNRTRHFNTPSKKQFQQWAQAALLADHHAAELTIRIVNSDESAELNQNYRGKNGPTNVLSFSYEPLPGAEIHSLGDLVLCAELVESEAKTQGKTSLAHWAHLTVHGALHLQGYDHVRLSDAKKMEKLEARILQDLGFSDPYRYSQGEI